MKRSPLSYARLNRVEFGGLLLLALAAFVMELSFTFIVFPMIEPHAIIILSGVFFMVAFPFLLLIAGISDITSGFDHLLSFGATRREAIQDIWLKNLLLAALSSVMVILFTLIERSVLPLLIRLFSEDITIVNGPMLLPEGSLPPANTLFLNDLELPLWTAPLLALAAVAAGNLVGVLVRRFGQRAGIPLYLGLMVLVTASSDWLPILASSLPVAVPVLVLVLAAALFCSVRSLLHASLR